MINETKGWLHKQNKTLEIQKPNNETDLKKAKVKFHKLTLEKQEAQKRVNECKEKGFHVNSKELWKKKAAKKAYNELEKVDRNIEKVIYHHDSIKKVMSENNLGASKETGTAIRGFTRTSKGYSLPNYSQSVIQLNLVSKDVFDKVKNDLIAKGFKIKSDEIPGKAISGDSIGTIKIEPFFTKSELEN